MPDGKYKFEAFKARAQTTPVIHAFVDPPPDKIEQEGQGDEDR